MEPIPPQTAECSEESKSIRPNSILLPPHSNVYWVALPLLVALLVASLGVGAYEFFRSGEPTTSVVLWALVIALGALIALAALASREQRWRCRSCLLKVDSGFEEVSAFDPFVAVSPKTRQLAVYEKPEMHLFDARHVRAVSIAIDQAVDVQSNEYNGLAAELLSGRKPSVLAPPGVIFPHPVDLKVLRVRGLTLSVSFNQRSRLSCDFSCDFLAAEEPDVIAEMIRPALELKECLAAALFPKADHGQLDCGEPAASLTIEADREGLAAINRTLAERPADSLSDEDKRPPETGLRGVFKSSRSVGRRAVIERLARSVQVAVLNNFYEKVDLARVDRARSIDLVRIISLVAAVCADERARGSNDCYLDHDWLDRTASGVFSLPPAFAPGTVGLRDSLLCGYREIARQGDLPGLSDGIEGLLGRLIGENPSLDLQSRFQLDNAKAIVLKAIERAATELSSARTAA